MAKPLFRQEITARMRQRSAPIPQLWWLVDAFHHTLDAAITLIQKVHMGIHDRIALGGLARLGVSDTALHSLQSRHTRIFDRLYDGIRAAHWYV